MNKGIHISCAYSQNLTGGEYYFVRVGEDWYHVYTGYWNKTAPGMYHRDNETFHPPSSPLFKLFLNTKRLLQ